MNLINVCVVFVTLSFVDGLSEYLESLDTCLDAKYHKTKPGPEDSLHMHCSPWKDHSCCTKGTSTKIHTGDAYNFNYDHCMQQINRKMSPACQKRFQQDHCFYECSPNIGPWIVKEDRTWRKERYYQVPLCASDCDEWYNDCRNDYTCTINWSKNFDWSNGTNACPAGAECKTIQEMFGSAAKFCEQVFDHSWKYTPSHEPCMRLWFDGSLGNPNVAVAKWKAQQMYSGSYQTSSCLSITLAASLLLLYNFILTNLLKQ